MTSIAIIPARGGSRRIPRKNIREFMGKPIIAYSIEAALESKLFDHVLVSTEDEQIAQVAMQVSDRVTVISRPPELAVDEVGTQEIARDVLQWVLGNVFPVMEYACCIYPCAPMLSPIDLWWGQSLLTDDIYDYVYIDGWFYWGDASSFLNGTRLQDDSYRVVGPPNRWIDINTEDDWQRAERMYKELHA